VALRAGCKAAAPMPDNASDGQIVAALSEATGHSAASTLSTRYADIQKSPHRFADVGDRQATSPAHAASMLENAAPAIGRGEGIAGAIEGAHDLVLDQAHTDLSPSTCPRTCRKRQEARAMLQSLRD
jgi:hypothetical protein